MRISTSDAFFHPQPSLYTTFAILKSTNNILHHNRSFFFEGGFPQTSPTKMTFKVEEIFGHPVTSTLRLSPRGDAQEMWPLRCGRRAKVCTFLGEACYRSSGTRVAWRSEVDGSRGSVFKRMTTLFLHSFFVDTFPDVGSKYALLHKMYVDVYSIYMENIRHMYTSMCADMMYTH